MVSEDGASVYSASAAAREEFPDYDVTVRGAVSIGRRLIDPLSELVKIDPKSIGVGQYQHSVDPAKLKARLRTVVESCVNRVGVNINTASKHILTYISGLGPVLAQNIVAYRAANGEFKKPQGAAQSAAAGSQGFRAGGRVPAGRRRRESAGQQRRAPGIVRRRRADGRRRGRDGRTPANRQTAAQRSQGRTIRERRSGAADRDGHPRGARQTGGSTHASSCGLRIRPQRAHDRRPARGNASPGIVTNITASGPVDTGVKQDGAGAHPQLADRYVASPASWCIWDSTSKCG